jgi:hypothetical protein
MHDLLADTADGRLADALAWLREPDEWSADADGLSVTPPGGSDFFRPPGGAQVDNACLLYCPVSGDFTAQMRATAELHRFGDAAALTVRASATQWAKCCLERSPFAEVSIVSVVTDPWSDDAGGELLPAPECHVRLTRSGNLFAFHHNPDGTRWRFVRMFAMDAPGTVMVGIHAQAPEGAGPRVTFRSFSVGEGAVADFRSGE